MNIYELNDNDEYSHVLWIKGAPERIWKKCNYIYVNNQTKIIDETIQENFRNANTTFAKNGERVLGFARILLRKDQYPKGF